jgi:hypothetical protein
MELTDDDLAEAEKLLAKVERNARAEEYCRWLYLITGVTFLWAGVWLYGNTAELAKDVDYAPPTTTGSANQVTQAELVMARRLDREYLLDIVLSWVALWGGMSMLGLFLSRWGNPKKHILLAKLARCHLQSLRAGKSP